MTKRMIFSYSSFRLLEGCPGAYGLKYIERKEPKVKADETGTVPGHVVHDIANMVINSFIAGEYRRELWEILVKPILRIRLANDAVSLGEEAFAHSIEEAEEKLLDLSLNLRDLIEDNNLLQPCSLSEYWFGTYKKPLEINDQVSVAGACDLYSSISGDLPGRLVDFKASNSSYWLSRQQLQLYELALLKKGFKTGESGFLLFKSRRVVWYSSQIRFLHNLEDMLVQGAKRVKKQDLPFTPSKTNCRFCYYLNDCEYAIKMDANLEPPVKGIVEGISLPEHETPEL